MTQFMVLMSGVYNGRMVYDYVDYIEAKNTDDMFDKVEIKYANDDLEVIDYFEVEDELEY